jgi:hypothetical protein
LFWSIETALASLSEVPELAWGSSHFREFRTIQNEWDHPARPRRAINVQFLARLCVNMTYVNVYNWHAVELQMEWNI